MTPSPSRLALETAEQPDVAARFLDRMWPRLDEISRALDRPGVERLVVVARGSSDNAARYAQYLWGMRLGLPVALATPSLHTVYGAPADVRRSAVIAISQSGASPDVVTVLEHARAQGSPTVAVTNDPASQLAEVADLVIDLEAGPERSVAATKTYTSSLLAVAVLAVGLGDRGGRSEAERALRQVPSAIQAALTGTSGIADAVAVLAGADRAIAVGRGLNLSTAHEAALKITELTGILVAPYSPADLLHGPVAATGADVPAVLVAPDEPASRSVLEIVPELQRRGVPVVVVSQVTAGQSEPSDGVTAVDLPLEAAVADWLTPLTAVVPGQLLASELAESRGVDVDRPGGLSKVTLTT
ncbi:MAG: SIS domain-containing protein [Nocardioidaceae bacterium]